MLPYSVIFSRIFVFFLVREAIAPPGIQVASGPLGRREAKFPESSDEGYSPGYDYEQL